VAATALQAQAQPEGGGVAGQQAREQAADRRQLLLLPLAARRRRARRGERWRAGQDRRAGAGLRRPRGPLPGQQGGRAAQALAGRGGQRAAGALQGRGMGMRMAAHEDHRGHHSPGDGAAAVSAMIVRVLYADGARALRKLPGVWCGAARGGRLRLLTVGWQCNSGTAGAWPWPHR